jgi:hypothetical protein
VAGELHTKIQKRQSTAALQSTACKKNSVPSARFILGPAKRFSYNFSRRIRVIRDPVILNSVLLDEFAAACDFR